MSVPNSPNQDFRHTSNFNEPLREFGWYRLRGPKTRSWNVKEF